MRKFILPFILVFILSLPVSALSHSGGTDSKGGHTNHATGEYHYHHGHPAHQHENGICPYESKATRKPSTKSTSTKRPVAIATVAPTTPPKQEKDGSSSGSGKSFAAGAGAAGAIFIGRSLYKKFNS